MAESRCFKNSFAGKYLKIKINTKYFMKIKGGEVFLILGFLLCSGFFVAQKCLADSSVVINEVAWMGTTVSANGEWIELRNLSGADIDLTGWTLNAELGKSPKIILKGIIAANGYFLLERTGDDSVPGIAADQIYTGALSNSGEILELQDGAGKLVDKIDASAGWPAGDNTSKQTMERKDDGSWQTSVAPGGTPRAVNDSVGNSSDSGSTDQNQNASTSTDQNNDNNAGEQAQESGSTDNNQNNSSAAVRTGCAVYGDVLINEFVSYPATGNEWVELYNPSGGKLSLDGWTITDGSGAATTLAGGFDTGDYFFVKEKFKGALNNGGDEIILYSSENNLIDKVTYGKYGDNPENNAPAPGQGQACALKIDGEKTLFDRDSYALTTTPTEGKTNVITASTDENNDATSSSAVDGKIIITEIFPNPIGADDSGEFIELYNNSAADVDLTGYKIGISGGRSFEFGQFFNFTKELPAQNYFSLYRAQSNLVLDNNGGMIKIYAPNKSAAGQILQYGAAPEGFSYCDTNYLNLKNADSSTRKFLNNSLLSDRWIWSAEPTPGNANQIKALNHAPHASFSAPDKITAGEIVNFDASDSFDEDGDSLSFAWDFGDSAGFDSAMPSHIFTQPGNFLIKLTVSDGQDSNSVQKIIKVGGNVLTAAVNSPIILPQKLSSQKISTVDSAKTNLPVKIASVKKPAANPYAKTAKTAVLGIKITAAKSAVINNKNIGAAFKKSGTVVVMPGVFGSQYFYIANPGEAATEIYNYKKYFPLLKLGDYISATGVVGGSADNKYLKTKSAADIKIIKAGEPLAPEKISTADFIPENLNKLVQANGTVETKNGQTIILSDGGESFNLYLKSSANVSAKNIKAGQKITAIGILSNVSGALAIMPRNQADLILVSSPAASSSDVAGIVLGAATGSSAWTMPAPENKNSPLIYILIIAGGIIIVLGGFLIKKYFLDKNKPLEK